MIHSDAILFAFEPDPASTTIRDSLVAGFGFENAGFGFKGRPVFEQEGTLLVTLRGESIGAENLETEFSARMFVFLSRHESASKIPALLAHVPGNWGDDASYGGRPREVCIASASALKAALVALKQVADEKEMAYHCSIEVTHHGPYVAATPSLFVELGSDTAQWLDEQGGQACAAAAMEAARSTRPHDVFIGLGGGHYAPAFTRFMLETEGAVSHIIPEYLLPSIGEEEVSVALRRTLEKPIGALVDWKGIKRQDKGKLTEILKRLKVPMRKL